MGGKPPSDVVYKDRYETLKRLQCLDLELKVKLTKGLIANVLDSRSQPAVAWSGGKDSTLLLYLILQQKPNIDVVWINTGVEFPECLQFVRQVTSDWSLNLHMARPETTLWKVIDQYGWPMLGKGGSGHWWSRADNLERQGKMRQAQATREAKISAACCRLLKETPAKRTYDQLNTDCVFVGNVVSESRQRFLIWAQRGEYYYAKSEKRWKAWPLFHWTEDDVWAFHREYNLPYSEIYDKGHKRNGCWACLMDIHFEDNKLKALRQSHPKMWHFMIVDKGLGKRILSLKLALDEGSVGQSRNLIEDQVELLVDERPCFFDTL